MVSKKGVSQEMMWLIAALVILILFLAMLLIYVSGKTELVIANLKDVIKWVIRT